MSPTVFVDVDNRMRIAQEEIFGPVVVVIPYDDDAHAIALANDFPFGLGGSAWTKDHERATSIARQVRTGMIGVNQFGPCARHALRWVQGLGPGREYGAEGLAEYIELKCLRGVKPGTTLEGALLEHWVTYPLASHPYDPAFATRTPDAIRLHRRTGRHRAVSASPITRPVAPMAAGRRHDARDPFAALAFVAAVTDPLRLIPDIPDIPVLPCRNPFLVAKAIATLDALSGGRFVLVTAIGYQVTQSGRGGRGRRTVSAAEASELAKLRAGGLRGKRAGAHDALHRGGQELAFALEQLADTRRPALIADRHMPPGGWRRAGGPPRFNHDDTVAG